MRYPLMLLFGFMLIGPYSAPAAAQGRGDWWEPVIIEDNKWEEEDEWEDDEWEEEDDRRRRRRNRDEGWLEDILNGDDWEERDGHRPHRRRGPHKRGRGPKFCRTGEGHPVYGREWCIEKGWGLGDDDDWERREDRWERHNDWEGVILERRRRRSRRHDHDPLGVEVLEEILGSEGLHRLARLAGTADILNGRLVVTDRGARVLQIRAGRSPLAELVDFDDDLRIDVTFVRR